jgi:hypothetical protein
VLKADHPWRTPVPGVAPIHPAASASGP